MITPARDPRSQPAAPTTKEDTMHAFLGGLVSVLLVAGLASAADEKPHSSQAQRMKECNAEAGEKKLGGDARKQFMSECLKSHATTHDKEGKEEKASDHHKAPGGEHNAQAQKM